MSNTVIKVENLSKQYRLGKIGTGTLSHDLNRWWYKVRGLEDPYLKIGETNDRTQRGESEYVWALKDINFEVKQGEVLGIIGKNGAGKSTLLKLLSRVTAPTTGAIKVKGRIASLLEVGTGFHPEMTGRENIYLNGTIMGMSKAEVKSKFDEIIEFSGTARYIDTPVKRYSSGMTVRLAFAVAAHLDPEILIVDEVLAVGDAEFQKKAIGKMQDVAKGEGRTVLFVSHNMASISVLCSSGLTLNRGMVEEVGNIQTVISNYLKYDSSGTKLNLKNRFFQNKKPIAYYTDVYFVDEQENIITSAISGMFTSLVLKYDSSVDISKLNFYVGVYNSMGDKILHLGSIYSQLLSLEKSVDGEIRCCFKKLPLPEGIYNFNFSLHFMNERVDHLEGAVELQVDGGDYYGTGKIPPASVNKVLIDQVWQ